MLFDISTRHSMMASTSGRLPHALIFLKAPFQLLIAIAKTFSLILTALNSMLVRPTITPTLTGLRV
jgi:hypothetical protein